MKKYRHDQGAPPAGKTQFAGIDSLRFWNRYITERLAPTFLEDAKCRGNTEVDFFPERGQDTSEAYAICRGCPVRSDCLELAVQNSEPDGIWGGIPAARRKKWLKAEVGPAEMIRLYDHEQEAKVA